MKGGSLLDPFTVVLMTRVVGEPIQGLFGAGSL